MSIKRLLFISSLSINLVACTGFYGTQPPAPVYTGDRATLPTVPAEAIAPPPETVVTQPLKDVAPVSRAIELKPEPLSLEQEQALLEQNLELPQTEEPAKATESSNTLTADTALPVLIPPSPPPVFQPLETFAPASPVVNTLLLAANKNSNSGELELATTTIERAIRIEPRNPTLFYKLAVLRLKQEKPVLAEDLAKKSALLATNNNQLKKHSWLLIARARELQKNTEGAKQARAMADKF